MSRFLAAALILSMATPAFANEAALAAIKAEPKVIDARKIGPNGFELVMANDGSARSGFAEYACLTLLANGAAPTADVGFLLVTVVTPTGEQTGMSACRPQAIIENPAFDRALNALRSDPVVSEAVARENDWRVAVNAEGKDADAIADRLCRVAANHGAPATANGELTLLVIDATSRRELSIGICAAS